MSEGPSEIRLRREEMFTPEVTRILEREANLRGQRPPPPPPVSPLRRLLLAPAFHLPLAGFLAAFAAWALVEPHFNDADRVAGAVVLVNRSPFVDEPGAISLTVGQTEVIVVPGRTRLEAGADGQAPFSSLDAIGANTVIEAVGGEVEGRARAIGAVGVRPATAERAAATGSAADASTAWGLVLFPLTAVFVAFAVLLAEGLASRNWLRMVERMLVGLLLTLLFSALGYIPAGAAMFVAQLTVKGESGVTIRDLSPMSVLGYATCRSIAWAAIGAATGTGMNLARSTRAQLRNSVVGGALGGALGGLFFDPISRFASSGSVFEGADASRMIGLSAVGLSIGFFLALVESLAREAWLRVRTGPLAGKQFVLYRTPTRIGSAPQADIYLFKDAQIDGTHAMIHRVGSRYELEDMGSRHGTSVLGKTIRRHRLQSGDTITLGATVLEFEERAKKKEDAR